MLIIMLQHVRGAHGAFNAGQTADVPDGVAAAWIEAGVAQALPEDVAASLTPTLSQGERETAAVESTENAMQPRSKARPKGRKR